MSRRGAAGGLGVALGLQAVLLGILAARSYFVGDDFIWLSDVHDLGASRRLIAAPVFNSFVPGFRALYVPIWWSHGAYWPVAIFIVAGAVLIGYLTWRVARLLVGPSPWAVLLIGVGGTSALWAPSAVWPADGLHVMPNVAASVLSYEGFLRHATTRSRGWLAVSVVAWGVALAFSTKALILLVLFVGTRALLIARSRRELLEGWWVFVLYAVPALAYAAQVHFSDNYYGRGLDAGPVRWRDYPHLTGELWGSTIVPALTGLGHLAPRYGLGVSDPPVVPTQTWVLVAGALITLAFVGGSIRRRAAAWRPWLLFAVVFCAHSLILLYAREEQFGLLIGRQYRYIVDVLPFLELTLLLAFLPLRLPGGEGHPLARGAPPPRPRSRPLVLATVVAGVIVHVTGSVAAARRVDRQWPGDTTASYVRHFQHDLRALRGRPEPFHIAETNVPDAVLPNLFAPWQPAQRMLRIFERDAPIDDGGPGALFVLTDRGHLVRGRLRPLARGRLAAATIDPGAITRPGGRLCPRPAKGARATVTIPLDAGFGGPSVDLALTGTARGPFIVEVGALAGGTPQGPPVSIAVSGTFTAHRAFDAISADAVQLFVDAGEQLCLSGVTAAEPMPAR